MLGEAGLKVSSVVIPGQSMCSTKGAHAMRLAAPSQRLAKGQVETAAAHMAFPQAPSARCLPPMPAPRTDPAMCMLAAPNANAWHINEPGRRG